jgi:hypothetical protein
MKNLSEIKNQLTSTELELNVEMIKGGAINRTYRDRRDDKRRQRPSGGTTTTSPANFQC